jgi:cellulose synthase/poly-beta-1,6-N-acetylglucosamine synthase-like glycosyltransferase
VTVPWLAIIAGLLVVQYAILLLLMRINWKDHLRRPDVLPKVSVLIAARNEEVDLPRLLASLTVLDYPNEKLEILIADDQSSDRTAALVRNWTDGHGNRRMISVLPEQVGLYQRNGKANALAILGREASGEYLFFTDADCEVPESWVKTGVGCFDPRTGLLIGVTQVKSTSWFGKMQEVDWWNTLGFVKAATDMRLPTTGLGNNMVISRTAYLETGGFEALEHSVTEDLEISRVIREAGFEIRHQVSEGLLVRTKAEDGWASFLRQRKRWATGALTLSFLWKVLLGLQFLFFPAAITLMAQDWTMGTIWIVKIFFQSLFLSLFAKRAGQKIRLWQLICFDFYQILSLSLTILYYFWPSKVQWKSRNYS